MTDQHDPRDQQDHTGPPVRGQDAVRRFGVLHPSNLRRRMARALSILVAGTHPRTLPPSHATDLDRAMMARARALAALAAAEGEVPVAAVIYHPATGRIVSEARNTREARSDPTGHAEVTAIREAARTQGDFRLDACAMAVTLEPCVLCVGAILAARIPRVVYGAFSPRTGFAGSQDNLLYDIRTRSKVTVIGGVDDQACAQMLSTFFKDLRAGKVSKPPKTDGLGSGHASPPGTGHA